MEPEFLAIAFHICHPIFSSQCHEDRPLSTKDRFKRHLKVDFFAGGEPGYYFKVLVPEAATPTLPCRFSLFFVPVNIQSNFDVFVTGNRDISLGAGDDPGLAAFTQAKILIQFNLDYQLLAFPAHGHILSHFPGLQVWFSVAYPLFRTI
jgi:hypothetical protein